MIRSRLRNIFGSRPAHARKRSDERGMALVGVVFLGMLFTIMGLAVFALSGYEYGQATQRDDSGSAFWLAEAAIEHAKAEIFNDITWDAGFDSVSLSGSDEGYYSLTLTDTVLNGDPATRLFARGFIRRPGAQPAERDVEVFADISPAALQYALFSMNCIDAGGDVDVCGLVHGNQCVMDGGSAFDQPDSCVFESELSDSFEVIPPGIRTEPEFYPDHTYYYVVGKKAGLGTDSVWVFVPDSTLNGTDYIRTNNNGIKVRKVASILCGNSNNDLCSYANQGGGNVAIDYSFNTNLINEYLDQTDGVFARAAGDQWVVVNFGEYLFGAPARVANLEMDDAPGYPAPVVSTIFNTRFEGPNTEIETLVDTENWVGGETRFQTIAFEPTNGFAIAVHTANLPGNANIRMGTPQFPCLFYVTGDIDPFNANGELFGSTIVLGDVNQLNGNPDFNYDPNFIDALPDYLQQQYGSSGFTDVLFWREIPPQYTAL
jgi:hypothetical protein